MKPGDVVMLDRSLKVVFVRDLGDRSAIISFAGGSQVVPLVALSKFEA